MNTENGIVRTEAMMRRARRARVGSAVSGQDDVRQATAMFSTAAQALPMSQASAPFTRRQSGHRGLEGPVPTQDDALSGLLNAGERTPADPGDAASTEPSHPALARSRRAVSMGAPAALAATTDGQNIGSACRTAAAPEAGWCSQRAQPFAA